MLFPSLVEDLAPNDMCNTYCLKLSTRHQSGNGLLPDCTKPGPMLTSRSSLAFPWDQFHKKMLMKLSIDNLTINGSDNGFSPGWRQAITWMNNGILLIGSLGTNFSEILIEIHTFLFKKIHLKMLSAKMQTMLSWPQCVNDGHSWQHDRSVSLPCKSG